MPHNLSLTVYFFDGTRSSVKIVRQIRFGTYYFLFESSEMMERYRVYRCLNIRLEKYFSKINLLEECYQFSHCSESRLRSDDRLAVSRKLRISPLRGVEAARPTME